jgi:hypothetical protein
VRNTWGGTAPHFVLQHGGVLAARLLRPEPALARPRGVANLAVRGFIVAAQLCDEAAMLLRTLAIDGAHQLPAFLLA